ncbi:AbiV family abortive infection protein [Leisingera aquaemixtae]|uniref:AbiV family abortive infection protein n=1 Tax=Leisingera aquaemixtae TaxID=1396826 RepID=UPI0021A5B280|nr:AbiV family abortive infection protein [Leisingera aquaemixtae]UWQ37633.1 AbiV family abortive infection protein [Leisingera aquaemixtae]
MMPNTKNYRSDTLLNAQRLLNDSKLLYEAERNESAIILAVFALEEFGKYLIDCWGTKNAANKRKYPSHTEKQAATFVVLHAREVIKASPKKFRSIMDGADKRIRRWGPHSEQMQWAKAGFYDNLRMVATYTDQTPIWPEEITGSLQDFEVKDLHKFFQKALLASRDKKTMELSATIYENGLGDL